jgi:hypothetical protein
VSGSLCPLVVHSDYNYIIASIWKKSAACFYCQLAAFIADLFYTFYLVKNHQIANISTTTEAKEKNIFGILRILQMFDLIKNNHI